MKHGICFICLLVALVFGCSDSVTEPPPQDRTVRVPAEASTIQAAVDLAENGDTVLVAAGVYSGDGNRDINLGEKRLTLRSESGPLATTILCGGSGQDGHVAFTGFGDLPIEIDGFSVRGAYSSQGSVMNLTSTSPTVRNCIFDGNIGTVSAGAIRCKNASPIFINCTFVRNSAPAGAAIYVLAGSQPRFENCIIAHSGGGGAAIEAHGGGSAELLCCNLYGNSGGNYTGVVAAQGDTNGNISSDPGFCSDAEATLASDSPCRPSNNSCGVLIGATEESCGN